MSEDTIAAIATAPGEAGIGIVRISGNKSISIADKLFKGKRVAKLSDAEQRKLTYGYIIDPSNDKVIDEVLAVYMRGPYTYTKEDIVEINCHGGIVPVKMILELILSNGVRMAERGEFTKRAFLNGRIDLAQAEAVMDLISAKTDYSYDISLDQLEGSLSKEIDIIRQKLLETLAHIEASIDFPEDDLEEITYTRINEAGEVVKNKIDKLLNTFNAGKILREGLKTVILGKPNVGKSSLLNAVLRENRAIVTNVPGTTRDIIEEYVNINGIPLKIVDTAGIRETEDEVEKIGVNRARELVNKADLVIVMFDASRELGEDDIKIIELIEDKKYIAMINKVDLPSKLDMNFIKEKLNDDEIINTSVIKGKGLDILEEKIKELFFSGELKIKDDVIVTNVRHKDLLIKAKKNIEDALHSVEINMPIDCIEIDVKDCWHNLGQINGETVTEDIIDKIFKDFCIGK